MRIQRGLPEVTLFGLPYVGSERTVVIGDLSSVQSMVRNQTAHDNGLKAPANAVPPSPENVDYGIALRFVPFEIIMPESVVIDGRVFKKGEAFTTVIPLSNIHPELYAEVKASSATEVLVTCTYIVREINGEEVQLTVVPDPRFAARDQHVVYIIPKPSTIQGL